MNRKQAEELYRKYREGRATAEESALIESAYLEMGRNKELPDYNSDEVKTEMWAVVQRRRKTLRYKLRMVGTAAAVFLMLLGVYIWNADNRNTYVDNVEQWEAISATNIAPGGNRATLTLADGTTVDLNTELDGIIIGEGFITYADGSALDRIPNVEENPQKVTNMSLSTPKGGQYQITLSDGTKVWLNANTTLRYPRHFNGDKREVILEGEAFFKVRNQTGDTAIPFLVHTSKQVVEVLGTEFNVTAYPDEGKVKTSLVEGSVRVSSHGGASAISRVLAPGQQSILSENGITIRKIDIETVTAWYKGYFKFSGTLEEILQQVSRWYEVDIAFREDSLKQQRIYGYVNRNTSLDEVLQVLEEGSDARFVVETTIGHSMERRVVVMK